MDEKACSGQQSRDVCAQDIWLDKAEACLTMGLYQPARQLLAEAHMVAMVSWKKRPQCQTMTLKYSPIKGQYNTELNRTEPFYTFSLLTHMLYSMVVYLLFTPVVLLMVDKKFRSICSKVLLIFYSIITLFQIVSVKKLRDQKAMARSLLSLAMLAYVEQNYAQAVILLDKAQNLGGDEEFWYQLTLCKVRAMVGQREHGTHTKVQNHYIVATLYSTIIYFL